MASSSKKRTTMAKLAREQKLRERRAEKEARRDARRYPGAEPLPGGDGGRPAEPGRDETTNEAIEA
jgi:hypothetical protein